jgi:chorismate dehydratase
MLRIGCVKYLNARPLIRGWEDDVHFDHPLVLCQRLAAGELDVALVSSFEFLRNPIYRIVDDVSISSDGAVYSVIVAHRGKIADIEEIELDPASETSTNLLRCLLAELALTPRLIRNIDLQSVRPAGLQPDAGLEHSESETAENISAGRTGNMRMFPSARRAQLLIGDQAIRFRQKYANEFSFWDLGEQWMKLFNVPFVYALWLVRPEVADPKQMADRLRALRDENLANLDDLIAEAVAGVGLSRRSLKAQADDPGHRSGLNREFLLHYYREHLRFRFGEREKEGLRTFAKLCTTHNLIPKRDLAFNIV